MTVALHWAYALAHVYVSIWNRQVFSQRGHPFMLGLLLTTIGLSYDNIILGMGSWLGIGRVLATLSVLRFVFHAILTPSLLWTGFYIAFYSKLPWARSRRVHHFTLFCVSILTVAGIQEHLLDYQAFPVCQQDGLVRYTQSQQLKPELLCDGYPYPPPILAQSPPGSPPWASIGTVLILILMGMHMAVVYGNVWLLLGSLLMCVTAAGAGTGHALWLGNGGEVLLVTSMTMAMRQT